MQYVFAEKLYLVSVRKPYRTRIILKFICDSVLFPYMSLQISLCLSWIWDSLLWKINITS